MDTTTLFLFFFLFLSPFLFLFYYCFKKYEILHTTQVAMPSPPGRWGWPVIGESLDFFSSGRRGEPEKFIFRRITKYGSTIFKTCILGERMVVMCGDKANKFLFANERKLVQSWWPTNLNKIFPSSTQTSTSSDESFKVRQMLIPNFLNPDAMRQYVRAMDNITHRHFVSAWESNEVVHAFPLIKKLTLSVACYISIGMEELSHFEESLDVLILGLLSIPIDLPGTRFRRAIKASNHLRELMKQIIKQRQIDLAGSHEIVPVDILSHMLVTPDENGKYMTELEIADKIIGLMVGAYEPTSSACASIVKYLAELPHIYDGVYNEQMEIAKSKLNGELLSWDDIQKMKYSWKVVCEVMRIVPPLQGAFREAMADFTYNGFSIPKGRKIYWSANATHRSPQFFKDPMIFDPSRFEGGGPAPYTFVPFGGGMRMCPGQEYARVEILVFMHHLVKRFHWKKVIADEETVMYPVPVPARGLPVNLIAHK